jgi:hypothetical protein
MKRIIAGSTVLSTTRATCGAETELSILKPMKDLSGHTDLCEFVISWLIREIQIEEMSKLAWLFGLLKHATWPCSFYFLYLHFLSIELN